jgi:hypothetical protein
MVQLIRIKSGCIYRLICTASFIMGINFVAYTQNDVKKLYAKVIEFEPFDRNEQINDLNLYGKECYYAIFNVKVVSYLNDTVQLALVYNILYDSDKLKTKFSFKVDSPYIFKVHEFTPCNSDFPGIKGCNYENGTFSIIKNSKRFEYKKVERIIDFFPIQMENWRILKQTQ